MPAGRRSSQLDARRALDRLRAMRGDRSRQREFAIELLEQSDSPEVLPAVLDVLAQQPGSDLRPLLHAKFAALEPGPRKRDPGGFVRAAIIRVLQAVAGPEDVPVFERAIAAYEPTPADTNGPTILRAAGLVALAAVDARSAALQAVTLLARPDRSSNMTGEPALTAVRVLAALGEEMALYLFALAGLRPLGVAHATSPEVVAEAVRGLSSLPASHLLAMFNVSSSNDAVIEAAFIDVAIEHSPDAALTTWLATFLRTTRNDDLYAFAVTSIVAK
ncbi:MAG TPA: hypothetical protein VN697_14430, partial [Tepidiformaceae bacterium]|nr:hypothetical protein [Tepidiformaceae bacterium]